MSKPKAALLETAHTDGARWTWGNPFDSDAFWHTERAALDIAKACLLLGTPVTDVVTVPAWIAVIGRLLHAEERLARLEKEGQA